MGPCPCLSDGGSAAQTESATPGELSQRPSSRLLLRSFLLPGFEASSEFALDSFNFLGNQMEKKNWSDSGVLYTCIFYVDKQLKLANTFMSL